MMTKEQLKAQLAAKQPRIKLRYDFYEQKIDARDFGISTPPTLRHIRTVLGWATASVDSLADRLNFRTFREDNFDLNDIYNRNNRDILFKSVILSALVCGCGFIYISEDGSGNARLQAIDGFNATAEIDPISYFAKSGYAVLERDQYGQPTIEAYFLPDRTEIWYKGQGTPQTYTHKAGYPLLVPAVFRPDARRPFGHSRISRSQIDIITDAIRQLKRLNIASEFYSFPQKFIVGLDDEFYAAQQGDSGDTQPPKRFDAWRASMSSMLTFGSDESGNKPTVGQFTAASMAPFTETMRMYASLFAGSCGLTLDDLGFATENPSSSEAIKAAHENLRLTARQAQNTFGTAFLNAGLAARSLEDGFPYRREQAYLTRPVWYPVFEPDVSMLGALGDGLSKLKESYGDLMTDEIFENLTGF